MLKEGYEKVTLCFICNLATFLCAALTLSPHFRQDQAYSKLPLSGDGWYWLLALI